MSKKFVVLNYCYSWLPTTQIWLYRQITSLQEIGVNSHVICEKKENKTKFFIQNLHDLSNQNWAIKYIDRILRKYSVSNYLGYAFNVAQSVNANILHSHFGNIGWRNLGLAKKLKIKHIVTFYGYDLSRLPFVDSIWHARYIELFNQADLFLCEGSHMAQKLIEMGCPKEKIAIQHLGVDVSNIIYIPRRFDKGQALKILIASSFNEKKGIPISIEVVGALAKKIPIELTVIGDASVDPASQREKQLIMQALKEHDLLKHTKILGYRSHEFMLQEAYRNHIYIHPSRVASDGDTEGGAPVSIIEMLATGMPVVTTRHCDIPEVMGKDLDGFMASENDVAGLIAIIEELVAKSPEEWRQISRLGRGRVEQDYSLNDLAVKLRGIYETL